MTSQVNVGDKVEDFALPDETGATRSLSELLAEGPVVLFFYPAALTSGCTAEACHFRDLATEFTAHAARGRSGSAVTRSTGSRSSPTVTRSASRCCPTSTEPCGSGSG